MYIQIFYRLINELVNDVVLMMNIFFWNNMQVKKCGDGNTQRKKGCNHFKMYAYGWSKLF